MPTILTVVFIYLLLYNTFLQNQINSLILLPSPISEFKPPAYPRLDNNNLPYISAQAYAVMDKNSHVIFLAKNDNFRFSPASTTKLMSTIVATEYFKPTDILTTKNIIDTQGSGLGLLLGEQMTFENLLYGMLLPSANDAAFTVAQNYPGGLSNFITAMNIKAKKYHLSNTHFADPAGLEDDSDYTTAKELLWIANIVMQNPQVAKVVDTKSTTITSIDGKYSYPIKNRNELLGYLGVNGIKTGFTNDAGEVLATSALLNGNQIFIVVMRSNDRFSDTATLLQFISQHLTYQPMNQE